MPRPKSTVAETLISASVLAELVGISAARVGQLSNEGVLPKVNGRYRLGESVAKYVSHLRADQRRTTKSAAEQRVFEAKAAALEMRNAERQRELIPLAESLGAIDSFCGVILTELGSLPALLGGRDVEARRAVDAQVRAVQQRICDRIGGLTDAHRSGTSLDEAVRRSAGNGPVA